jgi:hypothetical protein
MSLGMISSDDERMITGHLLFYGTDRQPAAACDIIGRYSKSISNVKVESHTGS